MRVPTAPLIAIASLALFTLLAVGVVQFTGVGKHAGPPPTVLEARGLRFEDRADGGVLVIDAASGATIETLAAGSSHFLRASLRGLAYERRALGVGDEAPFSIERLADGRLWLRDTVTDQVIDLWAFGPTNAQAFGKYLEVPSIASAQEAVK